MHKYVLISPFTKFSISYLSGAKSTIVTNSDQAICVRQLLYACQLLPLTLNITVKVQVGTVNYLN